MNGVHCFFVVWCSSTLPLAILSVQNHVHLPSNKHFHNESSLAIVKVQDNTQTGFTNFLKCLLFWEEKVPFQSLHNPERCYYPRCCTIRTKQLEGVDLRKMLTKVLLQLLTFGLASSFATLQSHSHKEAMNDIRIGIFNNYSSKHLDVKAIHGIHHCTKRKRNRETNLLVREMCYRMVGSKLGASQLTKWMPCGLHLMS